MKLVVKSVKSSGMCLLRLREQRVIFRVHFHKEVPPAGLQSARDDHGVKHDLKCFFWSISLLMVSHPAFI